jgi:undecaprenyl diphosphate synthase
MAVLNHLACIMDGNRRWAKQQGKMPWYGHGQGIETVHTVIEFCLRKKISYLSLYTFSLENFSRSPQENNYLFGLMLKEAQKGSQEFKKQGIRLRFIGDRALFPVSLQPLLDDLEQETAHCNTLIVNLLFCYGGRQEITAAVKKIAQQVKDGSLPEEAITPELIGNYLWTGLMPDPDLIIRTGGFSRLSNFLPYQSAYSELQVLDCLWPDLTAVHLQNAYDSFMDCKRNFGA